MKTVSCLTCVNEIVAYQRHVNKQFFKVFQGQKKNFLYQKLYFCFFYCRNPNGLNLDRTIRQYSVSHQYFTQFGADQVDVSSRFYNMRKIQAIRSGELISNGEDSNPSTNKYDVYNTFLPIIVLCTLSHKIIQYIWESR